MPMDEIPYRASRILGALGNPLRYRILARLGLGSASPTDLSIELNRPLFVISRNLTVLKALDLVWFHPSPPGLQYHAKYEAVRPLLAAAEHCAGIARFSDPGRPCAGSGDPAAPLPGPPAGDRPPEARPA